MSSEPENHADGQVLVNRGRICTVTLNRPAKHNAFTPQMFAALAALLDGPETVTLTTSATGYSSGVTRVQVDANETAIGLVPNASDLNTDGLDLSAADLDLLLSVDNEAVKAELPQIEAHLDQFGDRLPAEIRAQLDALKTALGA